MCVYIYIYIYIYILIIFAEASCSPIRQTPTRNDPSRIPSRIMILLLLLLLLLLILIMIINMIIMIMMDDDDDDDDDDATVPKVVMIVVIITQTQIAFRIRHIGSLKPCIHQELDKHPQPQLHYVSKKGAPSHFHCVS